jgi:ribosomal protein S18 acetylase RimI-like enzyme
VEALLYNPVYNALRSGDAHLGFGSEEVKCFDEEVSPFAGFDEQYERGFGDLYEMLSSDRKILYATPQLIPEPKGWQFLHEVKGLQFLFKGKPNGSEHSIKPVLLGKENVEEMVQLATLTKPGPFSKRTIEFGNYFGIFDNGKLVAMTGQRLHVAKFTEISAVCTHPDFLGKGFASILLQQQLELILDAGQIPFLHVREDNQRAIALYERLGFSVQRPMNFYFLKKKAGD